MEVVYSQVLKSGGGQVVKILPALHLYCAPLLTSYEHTRFGRKVNYLLKLFLSLLLHPPDVLHGQTHPFVNPAEQLTVEVGENTLFLLWKEEEGERIKTKGASCWFREEHLAGHGRGSPPSPAVHLLGIFNLKDSNQ